MVGGGAQSVRSGGVKVDGPKEPKWTVLAQSGRSKMNQSGRSAKVDGPERRKWTVLEGLKWTVQRGESGRS